MLISCDEVRSYSSVHVMGTDLISQCFVMGYRTYSSVHEMKIDLLALFNVIRRSTYLKAFPCLHSNFQFLNLYNFSTCQLIHIHSLIVSVFVPQTIHTTHTQKVSEITLLWHIFHYDSSSILFVYILSLL